MRILNLSALALAICLCAMTARTSLAQTFHSEEFSNDQDGASPYEPTVRDQLNDPTLDGVPPVDWNDIRNGWTGVLEEDMVIGGVGYPASDPGATTPNYGALQAEAGTGPYWAPSSWDTNQASVTFNIDLYADPLVVPNNNSVADGWWTNAVGPGYVTETGITWQAGQVGPGTWTFTTTTGGAVLGTVPVGSWYEMEVTIRQGLDGNLDADHSLWDATHTVLIGSYTATSLFLNPANQGIDPSYSWFTFFEGNMDAAFVDDFTVSSVVPEPSSFVLLGLSAVGLVAAARRRRRA